VKQVREHDHQTHQNKENHCGMGDLIAHDLDTVEQLLQERLWRCGRLGQ
jgi:hypothetical protein